MSLPHVKKVFSFLPSSQEKTEGDRAKQRQNKKISMLFKQHGQGKTQRASLPLEEPQHPGLFQCMDTIDNSDLSTWQRSPHRCQINPSDTSAQQTINQYKQGCLGWSQRDFITSGFPRAWLIVFSTQKKQVCTLGVLQSEKQTWNNCGKHPVQQYRPSPLQTRICIIYVSNVSARSLISSCRSADTTAIAGHHRSECFVEDTFPSPWSSSTVQRKKKASAASYVIRAGWLSSFSSSALVGPATRFFVTNSLICICLRVVFDSLEFKSEWSIFTLAVGN